VGRILNLLLANDAAPTTATGEMTYAQKRVIAVCEWIAVRVNTIATFFVATACLIVMVYAVYIGVRMATAQDEGKRNNAKQHLIYALCGLAAVSVLTLLMAIILPNVWYVNRSPNADATFKDGNKENAEIKAVYITVVAVVRVVLSAAGACVNAYAVWVGWHFMKAENEKQRTDAKWLLIYSIVGIIVVIALQYIANQVLKFELGAGDVSVDDGDISIE